MANKSMLVIQDDAYEGSLHLDEVLLSAIPNSEGGAAAFAFVTRDGLNAIFNSEEFRAFCKAGHHFELYIGIDSITNANTLAFAKQLSRGLGGRLIVKVYHDESTQDIFHAKTTWFRNPGGSGCVAFVGSGNLTMRGLQSNVEMFSWIEQDKDSFDETMKTWNGWLDSASRKGRIHDIDDPDILERAEKNAFKGRRKPASVHGSDVSSAQEEAEGAVLVSAIPSQSSRGWSQFNMAKRFYTEYFGFEVERTILGPRPAGSRWILLNSVNADGTLNPTESRGGVVVGSSNYRIELEAARNVHVDVGGFPMAVFLRTGARSYRYQVFGTDSPYNEKLGSFARKVNSKLRSNENPKCWTSANALQGEIPDLAIFNVKEDIDG